MKDTSRSLRCAAGFHHAETDALDRPYSHCSRCGRRCTEGATATFRGSAMSVFGVLLIFDALMWANGTGNEIFGLVMGGLLFLGGLAVIWKQSPG